MAYWNIEVYSPIVKEKKRLKKRFETKEKAEEHFEKTKAKQIPFFAKPFIKARYIKVR